MKSPFLACVRFVRGLLDGLVGYVDPEILRSRAWLVPVPDPRPETAGWSMNPHPPGEPYRRISFDGDVHVYGHDRDGLCGTNGVEECERELVPA